MIQTGRAMIQRGTAAAAVGAALAAGAPPAAAWAQDQPGAAPYRQVCQLCHGTAGRGDIAPALVPFGFDADYTLAVVREGYGQMPPISRREIDDDAVRQVVAYLEGLTSAPPWSLPTASTLGAAAPAAPAAAAAPIEPPGWRADRTPWGDPDLQGVWTSATLTPLERPPGRADQARLSDAEAATLEWESEARRAASDGVAVPGSVGGYNQVWLDAGTKVVIDQRTSLIVDPPDGRIPWRPAQRIASDREQARYGVGPFHSWTDLDTGERCITDGLPNLVPLQPYNMNLQILQTPGQVVMLHEMYHELRVIPLDGRPRTGIPQWTGEARGHWDGETLVVETIGFVDRPDAYWSTPWRAARPGLRLVERFTRTDPATIDYTFTIEDPESFTRPWTALAPMTTDQASRGVTAGPIWEYACHEGNHAMINILRGARAEEAARRAAGDR